MHMTIANADNFLLPKGLFIAAWKVWFKRFDGDVDGWREGKMPLRNADLPLNELVNQGHQFSVEVLTRLMVPWSFRDTRQVTFEMIRLNPAVLRQVECQVDEGCGAVEGARLTDQALDFWDELTFLEQDLYQNLAEARIQADIETPSDAPCVLDDAGVEIIGEDIYPPYVPDKQAPQEEFIRALVAWIDEDPFQPMYRRHAVGDAVSSWHDRLTHFFWPKPRTGYLEYSHAASPLVFRAGLMADSVANKQEWSFSDKELAIKTANEIFMLAGVPQRQVTWQNVRAVLEAALSENEASDAKMNSGWTYLACLATAGLEQQPSRLPLVSWNSRVATSVISRLDFLLVEAGIDNSQALFENIGLVPGWGGTRPRAYSLDWPSGYRSWPSIFAASRLVHSMVNILNTEKSADNRLKFKPMALAGGQDSLWTSRGVQLVLFSDGY